MKPGNRNRGAALLLAMLTVTLVASFAAAALWQQWRSVEIEAAERSRTQMQWVLNGALDWARLILQEDGRNGEVDHLSEPWALPLQEARLSSFLAVDKNNTDDAMDAFLSGQITDQQALLNVRNLVQDGKSNTSAVQAFTRLFTLLKLPRNQLQLLVDNLIAADAAAANTNAAKTDGSSQSANAPLKPYRMEQLVWLGLPQTTVKALMPYATLLPVATPVNLNTADVQVLQAALPDMPLAQAQQYVARRATAHFVNVAEALAATGIKDPVASGVDSSNYSVNTRYFAVRGRLRLGDNAVQEVSLVERNGSNVKVVTRLREAMSPVTTASLQ